MMSVSENGYALPIGESLLLNPDAMATSSPLSPIKSSPVTAACSVKAVFIDLDGPMFQYRPVFHQETNKAVCSLFLCGV